MNVTEQQVAVDLNQMLRAGVVEQVPGSWPPRWRLTKAGRNLARKSRRRGHL